jgi:hypothetical protein
MPSLYEPLDIESYEVRMISLYPGSPGSIIKCALKKRSLVNPPRYTALSYCWGDERIQRDIIVNNIRTPVTVNLEEALQQLRRMNVTRVWVDALCIHQKDKQEKSNQIRNMKHIYSKADTTYAWVGGQEADDAATAIQFLRRISTDTTVTLEDIPHTHGRNHASKLQHGASAIQSLSMDAAYGFDRQPAPDDDNQCQRCMLMSCFRGLSDLCDREYWKRRWVIQEVTAAAQVQVICGTENLTLENMATALDKCLSSNYWLPRNDVAYRYLQRILKFRDSYHDGKSLTLCEAIIATQDSLSKDARDKVFALIGVCSDGTELVPTPSYHQAPEAVVRDISRELLRRNMCFDIIFVDERKRSMSAKLPTWAPDWLSPTLPKDAHIIANKPPRLYRSFGKHSLRGNVNTLRVQGVMLGTIAGMTSTLKLDLLSRGAPVLREGSTRSVNREHSRYYGSRSFHVTAAILRCLLAKNTQPDVSPYDATDLHLVLQLVRGSVDCGGDLTDPSDEADDSASVVYHQWIKANGDFPIHGQRLRKWLTENTLRYYALRLIETRWGRAILVLVVFLVCVFPLLLHAKEFLNSLWPLWFFTWALGLPSMLYFFWWGPKEIRTRKRLLEEVMKGASQSSGRLVVSDQGMLGMAFSDAEVGDEICFLAGCTSAALLRKRRHNGETQYQVVGKTFVCLSREDKDKYQAFFTTPPERINDQAADSREYNRLMKEYKQQHWWQEFLLV